jgi:putative colanic acid biosynthesis glycosyltransferase
MDQASRHFSIVTVVLNDLEGLMRTANSILSQGFKNYEWVVIDGGSTDGTVEYLSGLDRQFVKWLSEKDFGIYDAMNKSIDLCEGQYLCFLNADDCFTDPDILLKANVAIVEQNKQPDILFAGAAYNFDSGLKWYRGPKRIENYIWHGLPALHQATFYKKDIFRNIKYDLSYKICGDYCLASTCFVQGIQAAYLDFPVVEFAVGGFSYSNPVLNIIESLKIQRRVLKESYLWMIVSTLKRIYSFLGIYVLSIISVELIRRLRRKHESLFDRNRGERLQ